MKFLIQLLSFSSSVFSSTSWKYGGMEMNGTISEETDSNPDIVSQVQVSRSGLSVNFYRTITLSLQG